MNTIPVIDIASLVQLADGSADNASYASSNHLKCVVEQITHACETFGFFAVTNHGVDPTIIDSAWEASQVFFDADDDIKKSVPMSNDYPYGYESHESLGIERSAADDANAKANTKKSSTLRPDSKETFSIGPIDPSISGMPSRKFPRDAPNNFDCALSKYFSVMENLARILFRGLALALQLEDESWFLREGCFDDGHQCALRILNYPQLEYEEEEDSKKVHIRAGAHTDYGAMTILKSGGPGLQLQLSKESGDANGGEWIDVPHLSDAFIINLGDLMQRWTNDRWRSTLHRVIAVADDDNTKQQSGSRVFQSSRRQSIAFFVNMNGNATIVPFDSCVDEKHPPRYNAIKASDHLIQRHAQSMGSKEK